ncbi:MAG: LysR family transcriptional regulator [Acidaminococcaceae bacterium]|nr:LysR family transcriptional regulator [Acidaminococcaceae bacterium]
MDFNQLKTFIAVVETGSFSRAGDRLFISQPTVTTQIKLLEQELSQQLLIRSTNGIRTTAAGNKIYDYAKRTLREQQNLLTEFGKLADLQQINIAASSIPGQYLLPKIIAAFHKTNPAVRLSLSISDSAKACKDVLERKADIGFCGSSGFEPGCDYCPITDDPLVIITPNIPPYDALPAGKNFPEELLTKAAFVTREEGSGSRREFEIWLHRHMNKGNVNILALINDNQGIINTVAAGGGISVMSRRAAADYKQMGRLLFFPLEGSADRKLYLVRRKRAKLMGDAEEFYKFVLNNIKILQR